MGLVPPWGLPIRTIILHSRWDGLVASASTFWSIFASSLRAALGNLLRSAGDHRSIPTAVAVLRMYMARATISSSIGSRNS
eukprot:8775144-Karenia_brevis.AAC.1